VTTGARRKLYPSNVGVVGLANGPQNASIHVSLAAPKVAPEEENDSDEEVEGEADWNWREDERWEEQGAGHTHASQFIVYKCDILMSFLRHKHKLFVLLDRLESV